MTQVDLPKQDGSEVKLNKRRIHLRDLHQPLPIADKKPQILIR